MALRQRILKNDSGVQESSMRKPRVLVCDDDGQVRNFLRRILEGRGYEVLTAETPVTCAFYRDRVDDCPQHERCTDVLITDYEMPLMTGIDLLELQHKGGCKLTSRNKAVMTGRDSPEIRKSAEALGCQFFIKPLPIPALIAWLEECGQRFDLAEPLASELYSPATKRILGPNTKTGHM
jgi:CheY-like chemotaxis protein